MNLQEVTEEELLLLKLQYDWSDTHQRVALAHDGIALNILYKDKKSIVRHEVAKRSYKLNVLVFDKNIKVRKMADQMTEIERYHRTRIQHAIYNITDDII